MITLVYPSRRAVKQAVPRGMITPVRWVYLGGSVRTMRQVSRWLGPKEQRISIAETLQQTAESLRRPYIDYIGRLGAEQESADWWFGSLSEKNPGVSQAFLRICYVAVAAGLARQYADSETLLLVVESLEVRHAVAGHLRESGVRFTEAQEPRIVSVVNAVRDWSEMLARKTWGVGRQVYRMVAAWLLGFSADVFNETAGGSARPWVLLHNWVDVRSFDADGRYRDIFFGPLREELKQRGVPVAIVAPVLYKAPYVRLLIKLRRSGLPILVPQAALTPGAVLRWGLSLLAGPPQPHVRPRFEGFDVSEILNADERMDWMNTRVGDVLLIQDVVRQWCRYLDVRSFIYTYEGHTWERGFCRAIRERFPRARLVGYQHSTLSPMYLSHFISEAEQGKVPFPDRVVTNGPYHYQLLRDNGIPEQALACGFRYGTLGDDPPAGPVEGAGRQALRILVTFSIFPTQAAELLWAAMEAFSNASEFHVFLKFHPLLRPARVAQAAGFALRALPSHMQVEDRPLPQLLRETDVLVYTDTTAAVEALTCAVPVVHLLSSHAIDMDRLGHFDGVRVSAATAEELGAAVKNVMQADARARTARAERWREVVTLLLPPPDEKTIDLFMPENV